MSKQAQVTVRTGDDSETYQVTMEDGQDFPSQEEVEELFQTVSFEDLTEVKGIGTSTVADLQANFQSVSELKDAVEDAGLSEDVEDRLVEFLEERGL